MRTYNGSCHCGRVRFRIQADLSQLTRCTCSICSKEGLLGCYVPRERFELLQGEDDLQLYQFNRKIARHFFCRHCGIHAFRNPRSNPDAYAVNVRCLDDFDLDAEKYEVKLFDGKNWEAAQEARLREAPPSVAALRSIAEAFNAHDLDAIMEFFAEDCSLDMPRGPDPWGKRYTGKAAVREGLAARFKGLPDVHYGEDRHWVSGDLGVSEWLLTGTMADGTRIRVRGCDHWEFRGGKVVRKDSYWKIVER